MLHSTRIFKATMKNRKLPSKKRSVPVAGIAEDKDGNVLFTLTNSKWDSSSPIHETHAEYLIMKMLKKSKIVRKDVKLCITIQPCFRCLEEIHAFNNEGRSRIVEVMYLFDNSWKDKRPFWDTEQEIKITEYVIQHKEEKYTLGKLAKIFTDHQDKNLKRRRANPEELINYENTKQATLDRFK